MRQHEICCLHEYEPRSNISKIAYIKLFQILSHVASTSTGVRPMNAFYQSLYCSHCDLLKFVALVKQRFLNGNIMGARLSQYAVVGVLLCLRSIRRMRLGHCVSCMPFVLFVAIRCLSSIRIVLLVRLVSLICGLVCDPSSHSSHPTFSTVSCSFLWVSATTRCRITYRGRCYSKTKGIELIERMGRRDQGSQTRL